MILKAFPKIFPLGNTNARGIFDDEVEITEKADGSQFVCGKLGGELLLRSKGAIMKTYLHDSLFSQAVAQAVEMEPIIPEGLVIYTEYLKKPKHNTLAYNAVPKGHLALYGAFFRKPLSGKTDPDGEQPYADEWITDHDRLSMLAELLGIDVVPLIFRGKVTDPAMLKGLIERESWLGGAKIEGVVVKNYHKKAVYGGDELPLMAGKYVSEAFKEVHGKTWKSENTAKGGLEVLKDSYRTEARWHKAVQHLRDSGLLTLEPKDIGPLVKEVQSDLLAEEEQAIKERLFALYRKDIVGHAVKGLPEWYKDQLLAGAFS